jgi:hypothetical protein
MNGFSPDVLNKTEVTLYGDGFTADDANVYRWQH